MPTMTMARAMTKEIVPDKLLLAKEAAVAEFLSNRPPALFRAFAIATMPEHNVVGVGVGRKLKGGKKTDRLSVRLYVERKVAADAIARRFQLPSEIRGVQIDVVETGWFKALPATIPVPQQRKRPASPGCSVGFKFSGANAGYVMAGTFGAVVESNGERFILSNNHVLADENNLAVGSAIFQPGLLDSGNASTDAIAKLTKFVRLKTTGNNKVDCAIAKITKASDVRATFLPKVGRLSSGEPVEAVEGMKVHKVGRTTGYTLGTIFDVSADIKVEYEMGVVKFTDQMLIEGGAGAFSAAGDSGSLIVDRASKSAVGLLFAGSPTHTIANHIPEVLKALKVTLVH